MSLAVRRKRLEKKPGPADVNGQVRDALLRLAVARTRRESATARSVGAALDGLGRRAVEHVRAAGALDGTRAPLGLQDPGRHGRLAVALARVSLDVSRVIRAVTDELSGDLQAAARNDLESIPAAVRGVVDDHLDRAAGAVGLEEVIARLPDGRWRLYSLKKDPRTGRRRNLGTFGSREAAQAHERRVNYFKHLSEVTDAGGREHAPAGSPEGGQFTSGDGGGGGGGEAPKDTGTFQINPGGRISGGRQFTAEDGPIHVHGLIHPDGYAELDWLLSKTPKAPDPSATRRILRAVVAGLRGAGVTELRATAMNPKVATLMKRLGAAVHDFNGNKVQPGADPGPLPQYRLSLAGLHEAVVDALLVGELLLEAPQRVGVSFDAVPDAQLAELLASPLGGAAHAASFADLGAEVTGGVRRALTTGLAQGKSVSWVSRMVQGLLGGTRAKAERVVRSEYGRVAGQAALATFAANADVVQSVQWLATLDGRTCLQCGKLDGRTWENMELAPRPVTDTHPHCRCVLVPVIKGAEELGLPVGTRASFSGQVPATETYEDWFTRQDDSFQRSTLGTTRYRAFQKGAPLGDFATASGVTPVRDLPRRLREHVDWLLADAIKEDE